MCAVRRFNSVHPAIAARYPRQREAVAAVELRPKNARLSKGRNYSYNTSNSNNMNDTQYENLNRSVH